jgi:hypothetical protein
VCIQQCALQWQKFFGSFFKKRTFFLRLGQGSKLLNILGAIPTGHHRGSIRRGAS